MSVNHKLKFLNELQDLKSAEKILKTILILVVHKPQKVMGKLTKVCKIIQENCHLSIRAVSKLTSIDKKTVRQILHNIHSWILHHENALSIKMEFLC